MPIVPQVDVSHRSRDADFARALVELLRSVLRLQHDDIQRTTVDSMAPEQPTPTAPLGCSTARRAPVRLTIVAEGEQLEPEVGTPPSERMNAQATADPLWGVILMHGAELATAATAHDELVVRATASIELEELLGRIAGRLGVSQTLKIQSHRSQLEALARIARGKPAYQARQKQRLRRWLSVAAGAVLLAGGAYGLGLHEMGFGRFEFESNASGWEPLRAASKACTGVQHSLDRAKRGRASLRLDIHLDTASREQRSGEAWINLERAAAPGLAVPVDLAQKTLSAWVYMPAAASGREASPNGLQLFVKDDKWVSHYGAWTNAKADAWTLVQLQVGSKTSGSHPEPGFAPQSSIAIGIKLELAAEAGTGYSGPVYLDSVDW